MNDEMGPGAYDLSDKFLRNGILNQNESPSLCMHSCRTTTSGCFGLSEESELSEGESVNELKPQEGKVLVAKTREVK